jgi:hypothetical protein
LAWNDESFLSGNESSGRKHDPLASSNVSCCWKRGTFLWDSDPLGWNNGSFTKIDAPEMENEALAREPQEIENSSTGVGYRPHDGRGHCEPRECPIALRHERKGVALPLGEAVLADPAEQVLRHLPVG